MFARETNPAGVSAAESKRVYLRDGTEDGHATLEDGATETEWRPKRQTITGPVEGPPLAARAAVGLIQFCERIPAKARAAAIQEALLPPPEKVLDKLRDRLEKVLPPDDLAGALEHVEQRGWSATEGLYRERARSAKRSWAATTGRPYGAKLAEDWRPDGWLADWDGMTVQDAETGLVAARDAAAALHAVTAVQESEVEAAEKAAEGIPAARDAVRPQSALPTKPRKPTNPSTAIRWTGAISGGT